MDKIISVQFACNQCNTTVIVFKDSKSHIQACNFCACAVIPDFPFSFK